jgi:hypothetical protein
MAKNSNVSGTTTIPVVMNVAGGKQAATVVNQTSSKTTTSTGSEKVLARDFPMVGYPLAKTCVTVKDAANLDHALRLICTSLGGELKAHKGCVKAKRENNTEVKVCAYRNTKTGKIVLEFNRLDGCAFVFQRAFIQAKIAAASYLEGIDVKQLQSELAEVDHKLDLWYGDESQNSLFNLLSETGTVN